MSYRLGFRQLASVPLVSSTVSGCPSGAIVWSAVHSLNSGPSYHRCMAMIAPDAEVERVELAPAAALFRSLGDPARLMIVRRLASGPARVTDLVSVLGLAQSTVSKHLACLRDCGLVTSEPAGRASVFRLAQPALAEMLAAAQTVLAATGNAVALCPAWGIEACGGEPP